MGDYLALPKCRRELALETRKLIDDYLGRRITLAEAQEQISYWSIARAEFMFSGERWNPTYALNVGKKRLSIVEKMLPMVQFTLQNPKY